MHTRLNGHRRRALMRKLWNEGDSSLSDIAEMAGVSVDSVERYLVSQPGWPNIIRGRVVRCRCCGVEFETWGVGSGHTAHCSSTCRVETRRQQFWRAARKRRGEPTGEPPPPRGRRYVARALSVADGRVLDEARKEARVRGVPRDAVLAEWKFVPERSSAP